MYKTKQELALELLGHNNFDCALPQMWLYKVADETGTDYQVLCGGLVWNYGTDDEKLGGIFGEPFALTDEARVALENFKGLPSS